MSIDQDICKRSGGESRTLYIDGGRGDNSVRVEALSARVGVLSAQAGSLCAQADALSAQAGSLSAQAGVLSAQAGVPSAQVGALSAQADPKIQSTQIKLNLPTINTRTSGKLNKKTT